jgi:hypothetical protein
MKDRYITMRNSNTLDLQFLYDFFLSKGGKLSPNEFGVGLNYLNAVDLLEFLDKEFELTIITDKQGNFIKVIS